MTMTLNEFLTLTPNQIIDSFNLEEWCDSFTWEDELDHIPHRWYVREFSHGEDDNGFFDDEINPCFMQLQEEKTGIRIEWLAAGQFSSADLPDFWERDLEMLGWTFRGLENTGFNLEECSPTAYKEPDLVDFNPAEKVATVFFL
jgi:hypothetical protein